MAQGRNTRGFGILPPLPSALDNTLRNAETKLRTAIATGEAAVGAVRNDAIRLSRLAEAELRRSGVLPRRSETSSAVKKPVVNASAKQGSPSRVSGAVPTRPSKDVSLPNKHVDFLREGAAGRDGFLDSASFGLWDPAAAAVLATVKGGDGGTWQDRYKATRNDQAAQDAYDAKHHAIARGLGGAVGAIAPIAMTGGLAAAPLAIARAAAIVPRTAAGLTRVASVAIPRVAATVGGGALGAALQVESDLVAGRSLDKAAITSAAIGGGVGGLVGSRDALLGAISSAVAGNASQAALSGAPISLDKMALDAGVGVASAALGHRVGHNWSNNLAANKYLAKKQGRRISKEELGEGLGEFLTKLRGERHVGRQVDAPVPGGFTKVDEVTGSQLDPDQIYYRERKFGFSAGLTRSQKKAQREYGDRYHVDRFDPMDIGKAVGGAAGIAATQAFGEDDPQ